MSKQLYFSEFDIEYCYELGYFYDYMKNHGLNSMKLFFAEKMRVDGMFWCNHYSECSEEGICGKLCEHYEPRNGKSGCCKHYTKTLYEAGDKIKIIKTKINETN